MAFKTPVGWLMHPIDVKTRGKVTAVRKKKRGHGGSFTSYKNTAFDSGPGARATGRDPSRGVSQFRCSGAAGRGAGVQEILAGGAPQHSRSGVVGRVGVCLGFRGGDGAPCTLVRPVHAPPTADP